MPFIRNTAWRATRATARQIISKPYANTVQRLFTAIPSRPCENLPAGPRAPLKRNFPSRFDCWSGLTSSFDAGIRRPVVAPPRAARKLRRDANGYMDYFFPFRDKEYCGMVSFSPPRSARRWAGIRGVQRKKSSLVHSPCFRPRIFRRERG